MYYAKVVPTSYVYLSGDELATNQFSVTRHLRKQKDEHQHGGANSHLGLPGDCFIPIFAAVCVSRSGPLIIFILHSFRCVFLL